MLSTGGDYLWQWPSVGATPINQGLDSEIFDTREVPHAHTFVREAVQNSLDARVDFSKPVRVRFSFNEGRLEERKRFLGDLFPKRTACGLEWPQQWDIDRISWLAVEDFNSTGLLGDISRRTSDFWNYWLNFGLSNKNSSGRGGRGIGRVTFLIASEVNAVIGITRRRDNSVAACGMGVLRAGEHGEDFQAGYAYLAKHESGNIYDLYDEPDFLDGIVRGFRIADRLNEPSPGLSLIIPYPRPELTAQGILAAVIEHFGPAIIDRSLIIEVGDRVVDDDSVDEIADEVAADFGALALKESPTRVLDLQRRVSEPPTFKATVRDVSQTLAENLGETRSAELRSQFERVGQVGIELSVPITRDGGVTFSKLQAVIARTPNDRTSADLFFRGGMCLPKVASKRPSDIDLVVQSTHGELVTYLNLCEGKAHLDLTEHHEVKAKLKEAGFQTNFSEKRFVRRLMDDIRTAVLPDASVPDISVFARYFSVPKAATPAGARKSPKDGKTVVVVSPPEPRLRALIIDTLADGFRVRANPEFDEWPVNVRLEAAYADGSRRPSWSRFDFDLSRLPMSVCGASSPKIEGNVLRFSECTREFSVEITGFDARREMVTIVDARRARGPQHGASSDA